VLVPFLPPAVLLTLRGPAIPLTNESPERHSKTTAQYLTSRTEADREEDMCGEIAKPGFQQGDEHQEQAYRHSRGRTIVHPKRLWPMALKRLNDNQVSELAPFLTAVDRNWIAEFRRNATDLTRTYVALDNLFGPSSPRFDRWKCSFSFPLLLSSVHTDDKTQGFANYVVSVGDLRGLVNMPFYRVTTPTCLTGNTDNQASQPNPEKRELSLDDIDYLTDFILGYLEGYAATVLPSTPDFYGTVSSEFLVYGKRNGEIFSTSFDDAREYEQFLHQIEDTLDDPTRHHRIQHVHAMLTELTSNGCRDADHR